MYLSQSHKLMKKSFLFQNKSLGVNCIKFWMPCPLSFPFYYIMPGKNKNHAKKTKKTPRCASEFLAKHTKCTIAGEHNSGVWNRKVYSGTECAAIPHALEGY